MMHDDVRLRIQRSERLSVRGVSTRAGHGYTPALGGIACVLQGYMDATHYVG